MLHEDFRQAWRAYQVRATAEELEDEDGDSEDDGDFDAGWLAAKLKDGTLRFEQQFDVPRHILREDVFASGSIKWLTDCGRGVEEVSVGCIAFSFSELFAGIGGFGVALRELNGRCVLSCEVDKSAIRVYRLNHNFSGEIKSVVGVENPPAHDILTAGFPCQSFTTSGDQNGFQDARGMLFWHLLRVVQLAKPRAILLENVTGFASFKGGQALSAALHAISALGYHVSFKTCNSVEGTPQFRERLYIVGIRDDLTNGVFCWPTAFAAPHGKRIRDVQEHGDLSAYTISQALWKKVKQSKYFQASPQRRLPSLDGAANTLRASYHSGANKYSQFVSTANSVEEDAPPRFFTPRECLRLQGFPGAFLLRPDHFPRLHYRKG